MAVAEETAILNFFQEPLFVLASSGAILEANAAAKRLSGGDPAGRDLAALISSPEAEFREWLRRCSGTTAPLVGSLTFHGPGGRNAKFRAYGARLSGSGNAVRIGMRCSQVQTDAFSVLSRQVHELNAEIRRRQRTQAVLEEALAENEILLRELHHRAKNNIQLMHGLFSAAQREASSDEVKHFLEGANRRLLAMGAAQQLMYQSQQMKAIPATTFLRALSDVVGTTLGPEVCLDVEAAEGELSNEVAFPLALIFNELVTNAFKHGLKGGPGTISVILRRSGRDLALVVHDTGPGFAADGPEHRSSGLGLVRGFCRQIGGRFEIENVDGARVTVEFTDDASSN